MSLRRRGSEKNAPDSPAPSFSTHGAEAERDTLELFDAEAESETTDPQPPQAPPQPQDQEPLVEELPEKARPVQPGVRKAGEPKPGSTTYPEGLGDPGPSAPAPRSHANDHQVESDPIGSSGSAEFGSRQEFPPPNEDSLSEDLPAPPPVAPAPRPSLVIGANASAHQKTPESVKAVAEPSHVPASDDSASVGSATQGTVSKLAKPTDAERLIVGTEETTFGREPWWSNRNYRKLPASGPPDDVVVRSGTFGNLALIGGTVRGTKHCPRGEVNDDYFTTMSVVDPDTDEPTFLIAVVCDGMGSAEYSSFSAKVLAEATAANLADIARQISETPLEDVLAFLQSNPGMLMDEVSNAVRHAVANVPSEFIRQQSHVPPANVTERNLQSTMTFALVRVANAGETSKALIGFIGDSPAISITDGVIHNLLEESEGSGVFTTATEGAIGATSLSLISHEIAPGSPLMLATDGVANFLTYNGEPTRLGSYIAEHWSQPMTQLAFIRDMDFDFPSADDDRTAVVIWARD